MSIKPPSVPEKKASTLTGVLVKLLVVVLFSLIFAAGAAMTMDANISGAKIFGVRFVGAALSNLLIGVFAVTFIISLATLVIKFMRRTNLQSSSATPRKPRAPKRVKKAAPAAKKKGPKPAAAKPMEGANLGDAMKGVEDFKVEQIPETPKEAQETKEVKDKINQATTERLAAELNKDKEAKGEDPAGRAVVLDPETYGKKTAPPPSGLSAQDEKQKAYMLNFLGQAMEGDQLDQSKMDNFNKFGVNLYLAGACEILAQKRDVDGNARSKILADSVQVMGFKKSHAASFADRYEEYLMADSRYMQMFQAGRNAMNIYFTDEPAGPRLLDNAMTDWNKPKPKEEEVGPVTVLFTDIAGSTAMTQALGDAGAQQVVRIHNRIVREALSAHAGKEVKHTGDGIMASFNKTSDGVEASIQMQRETMVHNAATPDLPLHLKIGLNAGEPIAEDNDLFGTVVQLSARIVDKASADQIYVSEIVRGICAGKSYKFTKLGGFPMKGFGDDITLFEVIWNEAAPEAAAPAASPS